MYTDEKYNEAVKKALANVDSFITFDGMNCGEVGDNSCFGWDGESRRCQCGNRRVYWEWDDTTETVSAVAY